MSLNDTRLTTQQDITYIPESFLRSNRYKINFKHPQAVSIMQENTRLFTKIRGVRAKVDQVKNSNVANGDLKSLQTQVKRKVKAEQHNWKNGI